MTMKEAVFAYSDRFHESFPGKCVAMTDEELIAAIEECLKKGEPYEVPLYDEDGLPIVY